MHALSLGNTEFEGHNNAHLLDDGTVTLVDTGIATPETERQLRDRLDDHGYALADVEAVVLTHWHPDHAGLAGTVQRESGATVYAHRADAPLVRQSPEAREAKADLEREQFVRWGIPEGKRAELREWLDAHEDAMGEPAEVEAIDGGDRLAFGAWSLRVRHAPGHTAGSCCFEFDAGDGQTQAFTGDALLPSYTPNVGGADVRVECPLDQYLDTLEWIVDRGFDRAWPGHRGVIEDPEARARTILDHHRERAEAVVDALDEGGPATAWEVSARLFGSLDGIHIMHGPGEAFVHLDRLERTGIVERSDRAGTAREATEEYRLRDGTIDEVSL